MVSPRVRVRTRARVRVRVRANSVVRYGTITLSFLKFLHLVNTTYN